MVQKFMDAVRNDPRVKELLKAMPAPKNDSEGLECYVKIARELGFDLTADEILAGLNGMEQAQKAQSEKIGLDDADLEHVAGGVKMPNCASTYESDGEWCWFSDSCSYVISYYDTEGELAQMQKDKEQRDAFNELYKFDDHCDPRSDFDIEDY